MDSLPQTAKPEDLAQVYHEIAERAARILNHFGKKYPQRRALGDELGIVNAYMELYARMLVDPRVLGAHAMNMRLDYARLWQSSWMKLLGRDVTPVAVPDPGDARFKDEAWTSSLLFDFIKQSYLIASRHIQHAISYIDGLSEQSQRKVAFSTRMYTEALAPSNFVITNPEVLRETLSTGGENLLRGLNNLLGDIEKGDGQLRISMTDEKAFQLGKNVATTPGKVVFQTDLMQLLQYQPSTPEVYRRPLLIIPPWINKYYILDLREKNSFIKWTIDRGHTVFVVSWVNPGQSLAAKGFDDYMLEGSAAALEAVVRATGESKVNVIGYCLGGTLLGATLAYLAAKGLEPVACATFFVSLLDFSQPGELGVFIDEEQVANLEKKMNERGYLEGSEMASTFNLMRANDLVWSFVINNYLLGKNPFPFDLLYWNSDSTRMPARMHSFYLRNMYIKNLLVVPGGIELDGVPLDLGKIKLETYFISTLEDHIAPWKTTYKGAQHLGGPVRFVLGASGHVAGIVNPPAANKYHYWTNEAFPATAEQWLEGAERHPGSWWNDWQAWIERQNAGEKVPARVPGDHALKVVEDAPGSYVMVRLGAKPPHD